MSACARIREKCGIPAATCCTSCHAYDADTGDGLLCAVEVDGEEFEVCCEVATAARVKQAEPPAVPQGRRESGG